VEKEYVIYQIKPNIFKPWEKVWPLW